MVPKRYLAQKCGNKLSPPGREETAMDPDFSRGGSFFSSNFRQTCSSVACFFAGCSIPAFVRTDSSVRPGQCTCTSADLQNNPGPILWFSAAEFSIFPGFSSFPPRLDELKLHFLQEWTINNGFPPSCLAFMHALYMKSCPRKSLEK